MSERDYYEILGVSRDVSEGELKRAYRQLAQKYHPDRNPGNDEAEQHFKEINEAYGVLSDSQRRQQYDQFGSEGPQMGGGGGDFSDFFNQAFGDILGNRQQQQQTARGGDLHYRTELTLEQVVAGAELDLRLPLDERCGSCDGTGAKPGTSAQVCGGCQGEGKQRFRQGFFTLERTCSSCGGQGKVISDPCGTCRGSGMHSVEKSIKVQIPPGVDNGNKVRLAGQGRQGAPHAQRGDLYVEVLVQEHSVFKRESLHLHTEISIDMLQAALGDEIEAQAIDGRIRLKIPEGSQGGEILKVGSRGVPALRGSGRGDMFYHLKVRTPVALNEKQRELLRAFGASLEKSNTP